MPYRKRRANWSFSSDDDGDSDDSFDWAPAPEPEAPEAIPDMKLLTQDKIKQILIQAAEIHPDVHSLVTGAIEATKAEQRNTVISFPFESSSVWHKINTRYSGMRGSQQFEVSFEVVSHVTSTINNILNKCRMHPKPKTLFNGLTVLRKIGKTICLSGGDTIGHEVQKHFQSDTCLEDAMHEIVSGMTMEQWEDIFFDDSTPEALWPKLLELEELAEGHCLFKGLGDVIELLGKAEVESSDEEDYEDHYEVDHNNGRKDYTTLAWDWQEPLQT